MIPIRVQRKRAKGYKLPENTLCVDRTSRWGNPFVVGEDGTREECVRMFELLCSGYTCVSGKATIEKQHEFIKHAKEHLHELKGKNLACFCPIVDKDNNPVPCHADILLKLANQK